MAEEGTFFKYPRIAWGSTDDNKCAVEKVHHKYKLYNPTRVHSRYLPESPPIISTNYAGPSKAKLLLQSSFSKFHLAPRLTYSPAEQSRFLHRRQPSRYCDTPHPLTAAAKARCLTGQPLHHKGLSWISKERRVVPFLTAERKRVAKNLVQIVPANSVSSTSAMDSNREDTMQDVTVVCALFWCVRVRACVRVCVCVCMCVCACVCTCIAMALIHIVHRNLLRKNCIQENHASAPHLQMPAVSIIVMLLKKALIKPQCVRLLI